MNLERSDDGVWTATQDTSSPGNRTHPDLLEALPRYLTAFDPAFTWARAKSEGDFILTLLGMRGMQDAGWEPYETTLKVIPSMARLHSRLESEEDTQHLQLWIYGHIMEASAPYDIIGNLAAISAGDSYNFDRFPAHEKTGRPMSPGEKIRRIETLAQNAGLQGLATPFCEPWNRELRNAVFHADYILHGADIRTASPFKTYPHQEISRTVNRALALFYSVKLLVESARRSYTVPTTINAPISFATSGQQRAVVVVRDGYGVTGIKHAWTQAEVAAGRVPFLLGRFFPEEEVLLRTDPTLARLPARPHVGPSVAE